MISDVLEYNDTLQRFRALTADQQLRVRQRVLRLRATVYRGYLLVAYNAAISLELTAKAPPPDSCTKETGAPAGFILENELPNVCALGEPRSFYRPTPK